MDSGFLAEGESLEDEYDVSQPLLPEEVLGLMDQILCHEVNSRVHSLSSRTTVVDCHEPDRSHGTWVTHYPRHFSPLFTSIDFYGHDRTL